MFEASIIIQTADCVNLAFSFRFVRYLSFLRFCVYSIKFVFCYSSLQSVVVSHSILSSKDASLHPIMTGGGFRCTFPHAEEISDNMNGMNKNTIVPMWLAEMNTSILARHLSRKDDDALKETFLQLVIFNAFNFTDKLPVELLRFVLSFLNAVDIPSIARTCRFWKDQVSPDLFRNDGISFEGLSPGMILRNNAISYVPVANTFPIDFK